MSLDTAKLDQPRHRAGKLIARCPACAEMGADKSGEHLFIAEGGRYGCIAFQGPDGAAHRKRIAELVGRPAKAKPRLIPAFPKLVRVKPTLPALRRLTANEMAQIRISRNWPNYAGLHFLSERGLVWFAMVWDAGREWPAWVITDNARRNAQARKLDGRAWQCGKAKTLRGCEASWPIGAPQIGSAGQVVLCEGQPDFAAALLVAWWEGVEVAPVCMTGAGNSIHADALPYFAGKRVHIATHDDDAGREAGEKWARQLLAAGALEVTGFRFAGLKRADGEPVKDLADYATTLDDESPIALRVFTR